MQATTHNRTNRRHRRRRNREVEMYGDGTDECACLDNQCACLKTCMEVLIGKSQRDKNILSTILGTAVIVLLCASLVEPKWIKLYGGKCCLEHAGPSLFISCISKDCWNIENAVWNDADCVSKGYLNSTLDSCISPRALLLMQVMTIFCFCAIISSVISFILDILAPLKRPLWKSLKQYASGYIVTVLFCATIVGFSYWISEEIYFTLYNNKHYEGSKIIVSFDIGVYLVTAAGVIGVLATASNLMRIYPSEEEEQAELLNEQEDDGDDLFTDSSLPPPPYNPDPI